jgi:hypothetical protein
MANRKNEPAASFATALKALLLCTFFVTSGVGYVWYKSQIQKLGDDIRILEVRLADLKRINQNTQDKLFEARSPSSLDARAKKMNLGLGSASVTQVVHLPEPMVVPSSSRTAGGARPESAETPE